jgi:hypothetical protein
MRLEGPSPICLTGNGICGTIIYGRCRTRCKQVLKTWVGVILGERYLHFPPVILGSVMAARESLKLLVLVRI